MITASLKNYRISPRKVRVVANLIRGKSVAQAHDILTFTVKKATSPLRDLLDSAIANAFHNYKIDKADLYVKEIRVDNGFVLKRSMPVSRGSAHPIKKRTSHVLLVLAPTISKTEGVIKTVEKSAPVKAEKSAKVTKSAKTATKKSKN